MKNKFPLKGRGLGHVTRILNLSPYPISGKGEYGHFKFVRGWIVASIGQRKMQCPYGGGGRGQSSVTYFLNVGPLQSN